MLTSDFSFSKTLNPSFGPFSNPFCKTLHLKSKSHKILCLNSLPHYSNVRFSIQNPTFSGQKASSRRDIRPFAGRSKKKPGGTSGGRIEGNAELRREAKRNARIKSKKLAESLFYRLKNPHKNHADNFSEEELQMIGLGYDRMVRFMEKDDPNLRHPYDWYKYGEYGPYSWRGVVVGDPIRGRLSDECVTLISEVRDHEEWEKIEQFEMASDFGKRLKEMDKSVGFRYFWVFVRHPKWKITESPWEQWTLICEVVLEAGKNQRLDKWNLMARIGNTSRKLIGQCAAWMRPDIVYVKRPVFQCRFEPQDDFFRALTPYLDPETERDYLFELINDDGSVQLCTYFEGLCKIVRVNQKAFVDDVVKAYEKLSDEKKSKCLEFLLKNHPVQLLHPYTKEWKAKLEEMELGCDAPDDDDGLGGKKSTSEFTDWMEDNGDDGGVEDDDDEGDGEDDEVLDMEKGGDDELGIEEEDSPEEDAKYWEEEFKNALSSAETMEKIAKRSIETYTEIYKKQLRTMEAKRKKEDEKEDDGDELAMRGTRAKVSAEEWKLAGYGPWRKRIKKSKIPPELFLRAAVRPFTYRNLVKEIVLTRHAILEGEIGSEK